MYGLFAQGFASFQLDPKAPGGFRLNWHGENATPDAVLIRVHVPERTVEQYVARGFVIEGQGHVLEIDRATEKPDPRQGIAFPEGTGRGPEGSPAAPPALRAGELPGAPDVP